jgi:hypothetical protein
MRGVPDFCLVLSYVSFVFIDKWKIRKDLPSKVQLVEILRPNVVYYIKTSYKKIIYSPLFDLLVLRKC